MNAHEGGCHCGNLRYTLASGLGVSELPLRACQCSFCRRHGALSTSDPNGTLALTVQAMDKLIRYSFGQRTAEFLVCGRCGIYIGAVMREDDGTWGIVNANTLDASDALSQDLSPMNYEGEGSGDRITRRKSRWTPVVGAS